MVTVVPEQRIMMTVKKVSHILGFGGCGLAPGALSPSVIEPSAHPNPTAADGFGVREETRPYSGQCRDAFKRVCALVSSYTRVACETT